MSELTEHERDYQFGLLVRRHLLRAAGAGDDVETIRRSLLGIVAAIEARFSLPSELPCVQETPLSIRRLKDPAA